MKTLDGREQAKARVAELKMRADTLSGRDVTPRVAVVAVGEDPASAAYVRGLSRTAERVGVDCDVHPHPAGVREADLVRGIGDLGADPSVHGILIQTPTPPHLDFDTLAAAIPVHKDVDGANPTSAGRLAKGLDCFVPATAAAVMNLLRGNAVPLAGARAVVIGRSATVGKPAALLLLAADATVTVCHSKTVDLPEAARTADVLVVAIGRPNFVDASFVRPGAVVVDVGINELDGSLVGDVDAGSVAAVAGALSPVPGGVGPLTNVALLENVLTSALTE